jgi:hypothetical protein
VDLRPGGPAKLSDFGVGGGGGVLLSLRSMGSGGGGKFAVATPKLMKTIFKLIKNIAAQKNVKIKNINSRVSNACDR